MEFQDTKRSAECFFSTSLDDATSRWIASSSVWNEAGVWIVKFHRLYNLYARAHHLLSQLQRFNLVEIITGLCCWRSLAGYVQQSTCLFTRHINHFFF